LIGQETEMKKLFLLAAVSLVLGVIATAQVRQRPDAAGRDRDRFIGAWRLASLEEEGADGKLHTADSTGLLVFTSDGRMSVQVMYRTPETGGQSGPVQYAQGGYEASFGRFEVDDRAHTFSYHVEGALVRTLVGKDLARAYELSDNRLVVTSASPNEHWRVTWERD
jgi:hypothetical protein